MQARALPILAVYGQFLANFATAVLVVTLFIYRQTTVSLFGIDWPIFEYGFFGVLGYFAFNAWSAQRRPGGEAYYHLDLWPSLIAAGTIFWVATAVFWFGKNKDFVDGIAGARQLLQALVFVAAYDLAVNQWENAWEMIARIAKLKARQTQTAAPGAFARYDDADPTFDHPLSPGDINARLILTPFLRRGDGSLARWESQPAPAIEHAPTPNAAGGGTEPPPAQH